MPSSFIVLRLSVCSLLLVAFCFSKTTHSFVLLQRGTIPTSISIPTATPQFEQRDKIRQGFKSSATGRPQRLHTYLEARDNASKSPVNNATAFKTIAQPKLIRGEQYKNENSTLPSPEVIAAKLGVRPSKEASKGTWQRAWKLHKRLIPLLHSTDGCKPPDSSLNLACMWWKALSGNDRSSPVYDKELSYDLLPSGWRKILRLRRFYPRLHHANVELRTAYLDGRVGEIAAQQQNGGNPKKIRLVCMGAGYDTRGVKMIERTTVDRVIELDLPEVVNAKERLFWRLLKRRPWLKEFECSMPTLVPSDFNDLLDVEQKLRALLLGDEPDGPDEKAEWHTIFVFEGVMIYLNDGVPSSLLGLTSKILRENNLEGSICFADRLENVPGGDYDAGVNELKKNGWELKDWSPKPGLARHMGYASLSLQ
ncbi:unnamed protein product [Pseudo-nitzschia multistriata]|uniref:S-adenosyl-L-methionine-dependent methyltransferase n=1 Tax=Pseudo-nitzschia multistriata TaxID=183589 RepID=A0A448ZSV3_9STRA|nr:unnamed protein product [Pseudo-nitzschia multistriata]